MKKLVGKYRMARYTSIIGTRISFYSRNAHLFPLNINLHLKRGIHDFHMSYVLDPAVKAANNVVVV